MNCCHVQFSGLELAARYALPPQGLYAANCSPEGAIDVRGVLLAAARLLLAPTPLPAPAGAAAELECLADGIAACRGSDPSHHVGAGTYACLVRAAAHALRGEGDFNAAALAEQLSGLALTYGGRFL